MPKPSLLKGKTSLMWASSQGRHETVLTLLQLGADVNAADSDGITALMWYDLLRVHCVVARVCYRILSPYDLVFHYYLFDLVNICFLVRSDFCIFAFCFISCVLYNRYISLITYCNVFTSFSIYNGLSSMMSVQGVWE